MVTIPSSLRTPSERAAYLVSHYWDNFDFADTNFAQREAIIEQAFVDYLYILPHTTPEVVSSSIRGMMKQSEQQPEIFNRFADWYEKYLYEPNSPMRNDEFYIPFLDALIASPLPGNKTRYGLILNLALRNRPGHPATDFAYTTSKGKISRLYDIRSAFTLIFFYNPDCHTCREVSAQLQGSPAIRTLMESGRLTILAIYADSDVTLWKHYLPQMPATWIVAHDHLQVINTDELYDLKAIPCLYLLDESKKVLLKDALFEPLEQYFSEHQ
jgi:thiol-disulfide isomerase/thioredoxin